MSTMSIRDAGHRLRDNLIACSDEQARDVRDILYLGSGLIPLPDGALCSGPEAMPPERREGYANLIDALYDCDPDRGEEEWTPIHAGTWESVLATLIIEADWTRIAETATELRADPR